jgi:hypothetical protein
MTTENPWGLGRREEQIAALLLQGCTNTEIARQLKMKPRTVKAHFNRLFERFEIKNGIKRVKLATLLYRKSLNVEKQPSNDDIQHPAPGIKTLTNFPPGLPDPGKSPTVRVAISDTGKSPLKSLSLAH